MISFEEIHVVTLFAQYYVLAMHKTIIRNFTQMERKKQGKDLNSFDASHSVHPVKKKSIFLRQP